MFVDLFAGPGGWDEGIWPLGICPLGFEWDLDACATARAAGHLRQQEDIALLDPLSWRDTEGLLASPPCQSFSMAGHGHGRRDSQRIMHAVTELAHGGRMVEMAYRFKDPRSLLVLEPLRWALALRPQWSCWEQVPAVLPLWEECAEVLRRIGYSVWTGLLNSEQYGVPQTRRRAFLIASRNHAVHRPAPTHSKFFVKEPTRLEPHVQPWVAMADVLDRRGYRYVSTPMANSARREMDQPAPTVMRGHETPRWVISEEHWERVTPVDMSVLQSFPADYPWQGSNTSAYLQVGNAVPPLLAQRVVAEATR